MLLLIVEELGTIHVEMDVPPYSCRSIHSAQASYVLIFPWVFYVWDIVLWNSGIFWFHFSKPAFCSVSFPLFFKESSNSSSNMYELESSANLNKSLHSGSVWQALQFSFHRWPFEWLLFFHYYSHFLEECLRVVKNFTKYPLIFDELIWAFYSLHQYPLKGIQM